MIPEVVAFDLGGVLVDVDRGRALRALKIDADAFSRLAFATDAHAAMTVGAPPDAFIAPIADALDCSRDEVARAWARVVRVEEGALKLVDELCQRVRPPRVVAWSNTDPLHAETISASLPPLFHDERALSFELGNAKPSAAFFQAAIARLNIRPDAILYLDDAAENVSAASQLGIHAHRVQGLEECRRVLKTWF